MESLKRMVTGQGLEETSGETGAREATLEDAEEREKCVGEKTRDNSSTEESEVKKICSGTPIIATHSYRKNLMMTWRDDDFCVLSFRMFHMRKEGTRKSSSRQGL